VPGQRAAFEHADGAWQRAFFRNADHGGRRCSASTVVARRATAPRCSPTTLGVVGGRQRRSASTVTANEIGVVGGRDERDVVERRPS
jgi:hypothetical protein